MLLPGPLWRRFTESGRSCVKSIHVLHEVTVQIIAKRIDDKKNLQDSDSDSNSPQDLLDYLMESVGDDEQKFSAEQLRSEVMTFLFAGHDTT